MASEITNVSVDELDHWDKTHVWHAFTQMQDYQPLVVDSAEGVWLTDIHGRKYLDGVSSLWCNVHGHRHPRLDQAIRDQLDLVAHVTLLGSSNSTTVRLAKKLTELAPGNLNHVFFGSDGASAVEAALKMAFQYWRQKAEPENRDRFMALDFAYHGDTIGSVSIGGVERFHALFRPLLFDVIRLPCPDQSAHASSTSAAKIVQSYMDVMRPMFVEHASQTAALILEPLMQGAAGMLAHPPGMLKAIADLCHEFDVLLIADEVAVGFGRTGTLFACEQESVTPDILCLGKGLTGGYLPLSATMASTRVWSAFLGEPDEMKTLFHGHTFGGNPLAAAVALANLELFETEDVLGQMEPTIAHMRMRMQRLQDNPAVSATRQVGMMGGIEVHSEDTQAGAKICLLARERNVLLRPLGNVVVVMPPLVATCQHIDTIFDAIEFGLTSFDSTR